MPERECPSCALPTSSDEAECPFCGYEFPTRSRGTGIAVVVVVFLLIALLIFFL